MEISVGREIDQIRNLKTNLSSLIKKNNLAEEIIMTPIKEES